MKVDEMGVDPQQKLKVLYETEASYKHDPEEDGEDFEHPMMIRAGYVIDSRKRGKTPLCIRELQMLYPEVDLLEEYCLLRGRFDASVTGLEIQKSTLQAYSGHVGKLLKKNDEVILFTYRNNHCSNLFYQVCYFDYDGLDSWCLDVLSEEHAAMLYNIAFVNSLRDVSDADASTIPNAYVELCIDRIQIGAKTKTA